MRISFIGAGNVATHLALAFQEAGHEVVGIYSRTMQSADMLAGKLNCERKTQQQKSLPFTFDDFQDNGSELYLISVKDDVVMNLAQRLIPLAPTAIWAHTAGSLPMDVISGEHIGVFYPMQTFSKEKHVDMSKVSLFIESKTCEDELMNLAQTISNRVYKLDSDGRKRLHLAAVFACNFVNHCYALSEKLLVEQGLPFEVMLPLIDETASKAHVLSPKDAQTGPAIRGDETIMSKQIELLKDNELMQSIYSIMSKSIQSI